jgi:hypothetical protein
MILPYDANPARMEFSERTGRAIPTATRAIVAKRKQRAWTKKDIAELKAHSKSQNPERQS